MNRTLTTLSLASLLVATTASPASAATRADSRLVGPDANPTCATVTTAEDGENVNDRGPGKVTMWKHAGKITATVTLRRAQPNTDYVIRLFQGQDDCHTVDGIIHTDRRGNASLTRTERIVNHAAQVLVDTGTLYAEPRWRAKKAITF